MKKNHILFMSIVLWSNQIHTAEQTNADETIKTVKNKLISAVVSQAHALDHKESLLFQPSDKQKLEEYKREIVAAYTMFLNHPDQSSVLLLLSKNQSLLSENEKRAIKVFAHKQTDYIQKIQQTLKAHLLGDLFKKE